jgi:carboxylesterase type B
MQYLNIILLLLKLKFILNFEITSITKIRLKLPNGQLLIGNRKLIENNKIIYEFLGLPFAQAPINEKRFEFPYRLSNILPTQIYDATKQKPSCPQVPDTTFNRTFYGAEIWNPPDDTSEDCLYMNMWVPIRPEQDAIFTANKYISIESEDAKLKTLFWFYGGSFISGSINLNVYDGTVLAYSEDIIVVSSNYRLGAFGFLYYNSSRIPGNAGLADQILAIEWYKEHYEKIFNAQDVCLFGESAGAMSIHFHMLNLNEKTEKLFNCAIIESGTAYLDIAYRRPDEAFEITEKLAEISGCTESGTVIIDCLKKIDTQTLLDNQYQIDYVNRYLPMPFIPTRDFHEYIQVSIFDPESTGMQSRYEKLKDFNFLLGNNNDEGSFFLFYAYLNQYFNLTHLIPIDLNDIDRNQFVIDILSDLLQTKGMDSKDLDLFSTCLSDVYGDDYLDDYELNIWKKLSKIVGDIFFSCPTIQLFDNLNSLNTNNSYFYKFSYRSANNQWPNWMGISHGMVLILHDFNAVATTV